MSDRIELRMTPELLERLDEARGETPRGTFIKRALESALDGSQRVAPAGGGERRGSRTSPDQPVPSRAPVANVLGSPVRKVPSLKDTWGR